MKCFCKGKDTTFSGKVRIALNGYELLSANRDSAGILLRSVQNG